jgi:hypothetical protein
VDKKFGSVKKIQSESSGSRAMPNAGLEAELPQKRRTAEVQRTTQARSKKEVRILVRNLSHHAESLRVNQRFRNHSGKSEI